MNEKASKKSTSKKQLTKVQAITVMVVGGLILLLSIVIPTEPDSNAHTLKVVVGFLGVCVGMVGAVFRPTEAPKNPTQ
jgi:uncharacterized membrane protein HdeD (DUF308 family)